MLGDIFKEKIVFEGNFANTLKSIKEENQSQTADVFSQKWVSYDKNVKEKEQQALWDFQKQWYLKLYGFKDEQDLASFLQQQSIVFDAGCGLGYLCEWFASLAPKTLIVGMDISDAVCVAAKKYQNIPNIYFIKGDIANTPFKSGVIDYVSCHAVIMHTQNPEATFCELSRILKDSNTLRGGGAFCLLCVCQKSLAA
ncbi:class I SAM-dependent methyltransferase [Helicobacter mesocricetorum]|uniref:class I SAM-dependent methyltransferase n=1 Tax=Helicobacter mesocricetorum TaxID=87012 RepID=UPI000CF0D0B8|nr:class I SAM-dependent methyltransferase [Helicobacter mesocricetorum]